MRNLQPGDKFGRLTITGVREKRKRGWYEKCLCDCGNEKRVLRKCLFNGDTISCGCFQRECTSSMSRRHGMSKTRIYKIFKGAEDRCYNKSDNSYKNYGGKGIKVLRNSFEEFYKDMGATYEEHVRQYGERNTTLDRINPNGNYCKENCKRSTYKEQQNNKATNRRFIYNGQLYSSIAELSRDLGISYATAHGRIKRNIKLI